MLHRSQRVLVAAEAVAEHRGGPLNEAQPPSLSATQSILRAGLDQLEGLKFPAAECGQPQGSVGRELAAGRLTDRRRLVDQRSGRGEVALVEVQPGTLCEGEK